MPDKSKTAAQRKQAERDRKRALGLVRKEIWIKPEQWEQVREFADGLNASQYCDRCFYGDKGDYQSQGDPGDFCSQCIADSEFIENTA